MDHTSMKNSVYSCAICEMTFRPSEPGGLFTGAAIPNVGTTNTDAPAHNWVAHAVSAFSPTWLNEAGFDYSYGAIISNPVGLMAATISPDIKTPLPFPVTLNPGAEPGVYRWKRTGDLWAVSRL